MVQIGRFSEVWERVKGETGISTFTQLAELVETTHQYVSRKKTKDEFPVAWAFAIAQKYELSTDWIMTGENPKRLKDVPQNRQFDILNEFEEWLIEEVRRNPERKIWFEIHLLDSFQTFAEWKRKRDEKEGGESASPARKVA